MKTVRTTLTALFLCLTILCGIVETASGAAAGFGQKTASGPPKLNPDIYTYKLGSLGSEPCSFDEIIHYDPATGVLYYVRQNPWTAFDPMGLDSAVVYKDPKHKDIQDFDGPVHERARSDPSFELHAPGTEQSDDEFLNHVASLSPHALIQYEPVETAKGIEMRPYRAFVFGSQEELQNFIVDQESVQAFRTIANDYRTIAAGEAIFRVGGAVLRIASHGRNSRVRGSGVSSTKPPKDLGDAFEINVKHQFRKKIINENEKISGNPKERTEIDFETQDSLFEVGLTLDRKMGQLHKLAEIAKQRNKNLTVIYHQNKVSFNRLKSFETSLKKKHGNRVRFVPAIFK